MMTLWKISQCESLFLLSNLEIMSCFTPPPTTSERGAISAGGDTTQTLLRLLPAPHPAKGESGKKIQDWCWWGEEWWRSPVILKMKWRTVHVLYTFSIHLFIFMLYSAVINCSALLRNASVWSSMRTWVQPLALLSGLRIQHCCELWCRSQTQFGFQVVVAVA